MQLVMSKGTGFIKKYRMEFLHLQRQFKVIMEIKQQDIRTMSTLRKKHDYEDQQQKSTKKQ